MGSVIRVQDNTEPIALYKGGKVEKDILWRYFDKYQQSLYNYLYISLQWSLFLSINNKGLAWIPYVMLANNVIEGKLKIGDIGQVTGAIWCIVNIIQLPLDEMTTMTN